MTHQAPWNPASVILSTVNMTHTNGDQQKDLESNQLDQLERYNAIAHDSDETLLHSMSSPIIDLKRKLVESISVCHDHYKSRKIENVNNKKRRIERISEEGQLYPARRTFVSNKRNASARVKDISDKWYISPERA